MRRLAWLGALLLSLPRPALAEARRVSLLLPSCELAGVNAGELRQAVSLELQSDGLLLSASGELSPGGDVQLLVEAACPAPDQLTLRAEHGSARQSRAFRLSELPVQQRARALSLSLSELASLVSGPPTSDAAELEPIAFDEGEPEPTAKPEPTAEPEPTAKPEPAASPTLASSPPGARAPTRASRPSSSAWRVGMVPELRYFDHTTLWGARAQLEHVRFRYGAGLLMGPSQAAIGHVWTRLVHASASYAIPLLGQTERSLIETGPRLGLGYTFMSARADAGANGSNARDWYADLAWTARLAAAVSRSVRLGLGAELGYGRGPIGYADDAVVAQTSGPFASFFLHSSLGL